MAFKKKTSSKVDEARKRLAGLISVDPELDLGKGLTIEVFKEKIQEVEQSLDNYNTKLSEADEAKNIFSSKEKELNSIARRMLAGVGVKFGYDSDEYEKAGGTRTSERKKPNRQKKDK